MDIIDSFVVSLNLDARQYKDEIKNFRADQKRLSEESTKSSKLMDANARTAAQSFRGLRNEVGGLFLAFAGASSLKGFVSDILTSNASIGRLSVNLGVGVNSIAAWEAALKTVGGTAGDADQAIGSIVTTLSAAKFQGDYSKGFTLGALGMDYRDLENPQEALFKMASASTRMSPQKFNFAMSALGINQNAINLLEKYGHAMRDKIAAEEKTTRLTQAQTDAAQKFDQTIADLTTEIKGDANPAITKLAGYITDFAGGIGKANLALPILIGGATALGVAALGAIGPLGILAGILVALAVKVGQRVGEVADDPNPRSLPTSMGANGYQQQNMARYLRAAKDAALAGHPGEAAKWLHDAYLYGNYARAVNGGDKDYPAYRIPPPPPEGWSSDTPSPTSSSGTVDSARSRATGFTRDQERGILAGLYAESGLDEHSVNRTSGAYGLGQWLGARKKALFAKYGPNPTRHQQLAFMFSELQGNAHGGDAIRGAQSAEEALALFINLFERPGAGTRGDIARGLGYLHGRTPRRGHVAAGAHSVTQTTSVGQITVVVPGGDADGIAKGVRGALAKHEMVVQANTGLQ